MRSLEGRKLDSCHSHFHSTIKGTDHVDRRFPLCTDEEGLVRLYNTRNFILGHLQLQLGDISNRSAGHLTTVKVIFGRFRKHE